MVDELAPVFGRISSGILMASVPPSHPPYDANPISILARVPTCQRKKRTGFLKGQQWYRCVPQRAMGKLFTRKDVHSVDQHGSTKIGISKNLVETLKHALA